MDVIKLKLNEFEDAFTGDITTKVSAGEGKSIRLKPDVWDKPLADIKKLLPQYTIARKFQPLSGQQGEMLSDKKQEFTILCSD